MKRSDKKQDIRELPAYGLREAAHYLDIPVATLRSWILGRKYPTAEGPRLFEPVIDIPSKKPPLLSFINLVEAHVLDALRKEHQIKLPRVREALEYLQRRFQSKHPLADESFITNGLDLFIEKYGQLINISMEGQLALRGSIEKHLEHVERDKLGIPIKLFPLAGTRIGKESKLVVIDPSVSFGRPVLAGTGITTEIIAERFKAGETVDELARDYGLGEDKIEEAIRCEAA